MTPGDLMAWLAILVGVAVMILAAGMWIARRKYPAPLPPTDATERNVNIATAAAGALLILLGWLS